MKARSVKWLLGVTALLVLGACGNTAALGEECDDVGSTGPCDDGLVCDTLSSSSDAAACLMICDEDADCAATQACTGVSKGNLKACHTK
jgi:hypothetical protein